MAEIEVAASAPERTAQEATPEQGQTAREQLDQAVDDVLSKLPDDEHPFVGEVDEPKRKNGKKPTKAEDDEAEPDGDEEDLDEPELDDDEEIEASDEIGAAEADEDAEEEDEDEDMALHRAYTTLHDAGYPAAALRKASKAELITWAQKVDAKKASATDSASKTEVGHETAAGAKAADSPAAGTKADWATVRAGLAEKLGIDEDAADAIKPLHDRNEALEARLVAIESKFDEMSKETVRERGQATIDREMRRLQDSYPELKTNDRKADKVLKKATTLAAGLRAQGEEFDAKAVFTDAARAVLGAPKRGDLARLRRNGVSAGPENIRGGISTPMSEVEYFSKAIDHAANGRPDLIRRMTPPVRDEKPGRRQRW